MSAATTAAMRQRLHQAWRGLAPRERLGLMLAAALVAAALLWGLLLQPALRTLSRAPAELERLEAEWQGMQRLAAESATLRGSPPVPLPAAQEALRAATARLGEGAELTLQGDRVVLRLDGIAPSALRDWLAEARAGARARPVAATLSRHTAGLAGTLELSLAGGAP
jgi:general secretion pathway protein M